MSKIYKMKTLGIIGFMLVLLCACTSQKEFVKIEPTKNIAVNVNDSTGYELLVFDPQFETWFMTNYSPAKDHSNEYYQSWNNQYVTDWNYHYMAGHYTSVFENSIDWDDSVNYGIELNRKLYYYFRYVETYLKVTILLVGHKNTT
jgi:Family of unknown function (DUF6146)